VAYNMGRGLAPLGGEPESVVESPASEAPVVVGQQLKIASISDFDPQADPPEERPDLVPLAFDGDPETAWRTEIYRQNFGPNGLKSGLGLIIDLGKSAQVSEVSVAFIGEPTKVSIGVSSEAPRDDSSIDPVVDGEVGEQLDATLEEPAEGRYVTLWLTSLPEVDGGFRAQVAEVVVRG
jgi:serine/threonine kinase PknH